MVKVGYNTDFITLVRTPRLRFSDQPYREDEHVFEKNLEKAIRQQVKAVSKDGQIDLSPIQDKLEAYTWAGIFKKVREVYLSYLVPVHKRPLPKKGTFWCFQSRNEDFCPRSRKSSACAEA